MKAISLLVRTLLPRLKFFKSRSKFKAKVIMSIIMVSTKGLVTSSKHVQYESPMSSCKKVMAKVKVFVHAHTPMQTRTLTVGL